MYISIKLNLLIFFFSSIWQSTGPQNLFVNYLSRIHREEVWSFPWQCYKMCCTTYHFASCLVNMFVSRIMTLC